MRRLAVSLVLVLLVSVLVELDLIKVGSANPYPTPPNITKPPKLPPPNPATIKILNPQNHTSYQPHSLRLSVSISDLSDIYNIICYLDDEEINVPQRSSFTIYLTEMLAGTHLVRVSVSNQKIQTQPYFYYDVSEGYPNLIDASYHICSDVIWSSSEVSFDVDVVSPQVSVLSPREGTYGSEVVLDFEVSEAISKVAYSLDGKGNVTFHENRKVTGLSDGTHSIILYAWDKAGNVGASESIIFTITVPESESEPFLTSLVFGIVILVSIVAVSFILVAYFVRRNRRRSK